MRSKLHKKISILIVLLLLGAFAVFYFLYTYVLQISIARYKLVNINAHQSDQEKTFVILFWTTFFRIPNWGLMNVTNGRDFLKSNDCPVTNCIFTHDRHFLKEADHYDALVFHVAETWILLDLPKTRSAHQFYVMASLESPVETKHNLELDNNFYNLTMTYRLDSDVLWSYAKVIEKVSGQIVAPSRNPFWRKPEIVKDKQLLSLAKSKTKTAVWFVSHCNAHSRRDELVKKLQQHNVSIDVYGKCGSLKCPRGSDECDEMQNSTYRFFLSFENSLCVDYVTEKLFDALNKNIIPIVYNGADNLLNFVPPKSFIDANAFDNVEDLAKYVRFLSNNPEEYANYFWWKKYYKISTSQSHNYCDLCKKLNELNIDQKSQYYSNMKSWWYTNTCRRSKIKF